MVHYYYEWDKLQYGGINLNNSQSLVSKVFTSLKLPLRYHYHSKLFMYMHIQYSLKCLHSSIYIYFLGMYKYVCV